ncbi:MAG: 4-hydroxy-tetrahydrodipicolinate synthase [Thermoprotei archaeon]|nr:MAG: 4-hydroxy-tetrahydrodipicolinate synthase [Thermoprotei archaeon]RLF19869.1 MAG: 4-hydroxy-tetrahydrodipicolinate synthase [Thermoprotei archaeon]
MARDIYGVITALLTPFTKDGNIDEESLRELIRFQIEHEVNAFFPCGTAGEGMLMPPELRKKVTEIVVDEVNGKVPVIVHVGTSDTETTVELAKHAEDCGADAVSAITPYYYKHDVKSLILHYREISESVDIPVYVYNNPGRTGINVTPEVLGRLVDEANIKGIKDSSKDLIQFADYVLMFNDRINLIIGSDALFLPALVIGAKGLVSALSNVFPEVVVNVYKAIVNGNLEEARKAFFLMLKIRNVLKEGPYLAAYKEALNLRGIKFEGFRKPLRPLNEKERNLLRDKLKSLVPDLL